MRALKTALSLCCMALALSAAPAFAVNCPGPDAFGHSCQEPACTGCTFLTHPSATPVPFLSLDDACALVVLPVGFSATHYGTALTQVGVSTNGYLVANTCTGGTDLSNDCPLPNTLSPNNTIAGYWDDLNVAGLIPNGVVRSFVLGTAPNRVFVVSYVNMPRFGGGGRITFQIQIHENGGIVGYEREVVVVGAATAAVFSATTGIENSGGTDGLTRQPCSASVVQNPAVQNFCVSFVKGTPPASEAGGCENDVDDDCDGLVDCFDPDCPPAPPEGGIQCRNGADDDCDGLVDCADPDCVNNTDTPEAPSRCEDGLENDCDGLIDCDDPDCNDYKPETSCENNLDDNCDQLIDCDDPDCADWYGCVALRGLAALESKLDERGLALDVLVGGAEKMKDVDCEILRLLDTPQGQTTATCDGITYEWNGGP